MKVQADGFEFEFPEALSAIVFDEKIVGNRITTVCLMPRRPPKLPH